VLHDQELTALVSSRICHDLISPIGAISNGVELLALGTKNTSPELDLIGESVSSATDKLRCFRIAFGAAEIGARLPTSEIVTATEAMFSGRASVSFTGDMPADVPRAVGKALLLTLLCQERCLPLGGRSEVSLAGDGFKVVTAAPRLKDLGQLWLLVDRDARPQKVIPAEVQFPLLGQLLHTYGQTLSREFGEERIELALSGLSTPAA